MDDCVTPRRGEEERQNRCRSRFRWKSESSLRPEPRVVVHEHLLPSITRSSLSTDSGNNHLVSILSILQVTTMICPMPELRQVTSAVQVLYLGGLLPRVLCGARISTRRGSHTMLCGTMAERGGCRRWCLFIGRAEDTPQRKFVSGEVKEGGVMMES